ncbi:hypothetical protein [Dietzia alimentaria]|uniref:hypothetical protein n=1 Tax=Dietzia alimentaria TaxID=665550 RepID=UPI00029A40E7|nr:hypothetical protein [Dietzia alimentaria]
MSDSPSYLSERVLERVDRSRANLAWLSGELAQRPDGLGLQLSRVCELVNLALGQVEDHGDLGMAWILLEQARQQLGHAAVMAAKGGVRRGTRANEAEVKEEKSAMAHLVWFLQRDLTPWPEDVSMVVDFGDESGAVPDFRPDTSFELLPLQLLAHTAMTVSAGEGAQSVGDRVMEMAFGEYVGAIMNEAMELLDEFGADQSGAEAQVETGFEVSHLVSGAFTQALQVFEGPAGFPTEED